MKLKKYVHNFRCPSILFPSPGSIPARPVFCLTPTGSKVCLEGRVGVVDEVLKVSLVPLAGLGRGLVGIRLAAEAVVADGGAVAGTVRLATGLDPHESVGELEASVSSGADTETGTADVAPVTPFLTETLDTVAASINDGVVWHTSRLELLTELGDVDLLVLALVVLGIRGGRELAGAQVPGVPASNVGGNTTELLGGASSLVSLGQLLGARLEVSIPAEPTAVTSVEVHNDVGKIEGLKGISDTVAVAGSAVLAGLEVAVGDQVGERIRLDDQGESRVGVGLEEIGND